MATGFLVYADDDEAFDAKIFAEEALAEAVDVLLLFDELEKRLAHEGVEGTAGVVAVTGGAKLMAGADVAVSVVAAADKLAAFGVLLDVLCP